MVQYRRCQIVQKDETFILLTVEDSIKMKMLRIYCQMTIQHWALKYVLEGLYRSPVHTLLEKGIKVVDAGCGPATWTFEMAETYPTSSFTGLDISFVFPETIRPVNVDFSICNITKEIPLEDNSIDYYHQRLLVAGLTEDDMRAALRNAYRVLKPGGYIELGEVNFETLENMGPIYCQFNIIFTGMMKKKGLIPDMGDHIGIFLEETGFENIYYEKICVPVNHTNKAGKLMWYDIRETGLSLKPMIAMSNPAYEDNDAYVKYMDAIGEENAEYKTNFFYCIAYAQKPFE
ncbi:S-adenosyl-L-methionine-dependent methyltransferase [Pilobolus umbonatus]|nr:S-adenosyl-L-methionine-dependent methyltransferase [Pilobolus umbonatus]